MNQSFTTGTIGWIAGVCMMAVTTQAADLVVRDARIWTADQSSPWAEAMAIEDDRIAAVGSWADVQPLVNENTRVIRAHEGMIVPGMIDAHLHFITGGFRLASVQLRDASTPEMFVERIAAFARTLEPGEWITGGDWDHTLWGGELPRRDWIDAVTPDNPVWISRLDGHMALGNSRTLELAGVDADTPDVPGGEIERDESGRPTGVLKDNAMTYVYRVLPDPSDAMKDRALEAAMTYVAQQGVTSVHNMGSWDDLEVFQRAHAADRLRTRLYAAVPISSWQRLNDYVATHGRGDTWLRWGALKGFMDGSLGSKTAAFFEDFDDEPGNSGLMVVTHDTMKDWVINADAAGLHILIHAIGDRAIHRLLDIFAEATGTNGDRDRRFRIEHAQHIAPQDFQRFADLNVIASMQPYHAIDDGRWAEELIGERIRTTYAFRSLLDAQAHVAFGSDWFVAPPTPLEGIYAAVTRRTLDGENPDGWVPEEKITVEEALYAYTLDAAYASFEEDRKGSLERGKLADFVWIDQDLTTIPPETIRDASIRLTVVGGKVVYDASVAE